MIKLICFDMDGVLVDACNLHKTSLELAMQEELGYKISDNDHHNKFNGLPTRKKLQILGVDDVKSELINQKKQKYTIELIKNNIKKDESKIELLTYLKNKNYLIACVTNSILITTQLMLKQCGIYDFFDLIVSNESIKNCKPDPEPYLFAMQSMKARPFETIIIEDSENGLKAAYSSGSKVVKVSGPEEVNLENLRDKLCKY